jgi:hypothetical protein
MTLQAPGSNAGTVWAPVSRLDTAGSVFGFDTSVFDMACMIACDSGGRTPAGLLELSVGDCRMRFEPRLGDATSWTARATMPRCSAMDREVWHAALLGANTGLMQHACLAFALGADAMPTLFGRLHVKPGDHLGLAGQLQRLHDVWRLAHGIAVAERSSPIAMSAIDEFLMPLHRPRWPAQGDECEPDDFVIDCLLATGLSKQQACAMAAAGRLRVDDTEIHFEEACGGRSMLMHVTLRSALLDGTADAALQLTAALMDDHGVAVGRTLSGYQLIAHWPCEASRIADFGVYLALFAELPTAILGDTTVRDATDTDLDCLLPHL